MRSEATLSQRASRSNIGAAIVSVGTRMTAPTVAQTVRWRTAPGSTATPRFTAGCGRVTDLPFRVPRHNPEERALRKMRFLVVALIAVFGISAVAFAQQNAYTVTAKV